MGMIICDKHGRQGIQLVCAHLRNQVAEGKSLSALEQRVDSEFQELNYFLCALCSLNYVADAKFEDIKLEPVCGSCFWESVKKVNETK